MVSNPSPPHKGLTASPLEGREGLFSDAVQVQARRLAPFLKTLDSVCESAPGTVPVLPPGGYPKEAEAIEPDSWALAHAQPANQLNSMRVEHIAAIRSIRGEELAFAGIKNLIPLRVRRRVENG
jgi:hypothetical protein